MMINMQIKFRNIWLIVLLLLLISLVSGSEFEMQDLQASASSIEIEWHYVYGLEGTDVPGSVIQSANGGFLVAGSTSSYGLGGPADFWLFEVDANGLFLWNNTFGSLEQDVVTSLIQTSAGGFALLGRNYAFSDNGTMWLVKTDSNGNHEWNVTLGGSANDVSLIQTLDGGFAFLATTDSFGAGGDDMWLVKTDSTGNHEWNKTFGGSIDDLSGALIQTSDGGYFLGGSTYSYSPSYSDFWLVKTDANGDFVWNQTFRGGFEEGLISLMPTSDSGFVLAGATEIWGGGNLFFVKSDSSGNLVWNKTLGAPSNSWFTSIIQTSDEGFVAAGSSGNNNDFLLIKTDSLGQKEWEQNIPREGDHCVPWPQVIQTADGGLLISGWHAVDIATEDWDIELIKIAPIQDISSTTTNGTFGFSALLILVVLVGFSTRRRRR
jgi:hypothetical protein